ncbi:WD repeat-containing protein YMR102C isoform X1 [Primulina huaijiensis]|uniref:WD repeat-containing protein YMR102C isoform X1 n=1 Tax=Primulina huaijiensis TaxID=1492673 RepID=UPI003CC78EB0
MDSFSDDTEESRFFDALEHITSEPDSASDINNWEYDVWINTPQSVRDRRMKFIRWMGLCSNDLEEENFFDEYDRPEGGVFKGDMDRILGNSGAVLRTSGIIDELSSSQSSISSWNTDDLELTQGANLGKFRSREVEKFSQSSPQVHQLVQREIDVHGNTPRTVNKLRNKWLCKLRSVTCLMNGNVKEDNVELNSFSQGQGSRFRRVQVRHCRRRLKELSALFTRQDIQAHEGTILTMKFSLDGQYLASAGEDKLVKVWRVVDDERLNERYIPDVDPSCVYFSVNELSELSPLMVEKDKINKSNTLHRTPDSACIVFPPKIFQLQEVPLHVFQGHCGEILDLSWSKNNRLLSSSVDKTVRLWQLGVNNCLKVFLHSDYVTCIQFNPVNDDHFISGSIDGKVRIWAIDGCQVVGWTESKDIITAVSHRPDGQGGVFGSITGTCQFFEISDNHLQLETQICLTNKKKSSPCKRITGFQFLPQDPSKLLVTCADSQVRIIDGINVIAKYKGFRTCGIHLSASFTSDGKHIVSASEDSSVYVWNYIGQEENSFFHPKAIRSFECFSADASVAIPWPGSKTGNTMDRLQSRKLPGSSINYLPFSPSTRFLLSQEFFVDSSSKGSATWPEEKLPASDQEAESSMSKSQYKLFKNSWQNLSSSHAYGLVIVTAGWDGRIRSFHNYGLPATL